MNHEGEVFGDLTIVAKSANKAPNGYLHYYWVKCACGNFKRMRYDNIKRDKSCGLCEDFEASQVINKILKG